MSSKFLILLLNLGKFLSGIFGFHILAVTDKISVCAVKVQCLAHTGILVNFPCGFLSKMKKKALPHTFIIIEYVIKIMMF